MSERLNKENFNSSINQEKLVLVDFYSDSCIPCKKLNPVLAQLEESSAGKAVIYKVNINFDSELAEKYNVLSAPTLILFKAGKEIDSKTGFQTLETLEEWIDEIISNQ